MSIRTLAVLVTLCIVSSCALAVELAPPRQVDERRAAVVGIRKIVGRHLRLYTDLPPSDAVDSLGAVFDQAVPQWGEYFGIEPEKLRGWQLQGYLMQDRAKFNALGLLPDENKNFPNGFCNGYEFWLTEQPSDYYRRHLMLHEATHGFMYTQFGEAGAGWYSEGMAELLGTHRWQNGRLTLQVVPPDKNDVPMWGRIKLIRDAIEADRPISLPAVMSFRRGRTLNTNQYAWCWALCSLLDSQAEYQAKFRALQQHVTDDDFTRRAKEVFQPEWDDLLVEWQALIAELDYGYDLQRMAMQHKASEPLTGEASLSLRADRGWQSSGWQLRKGESYAVIADGRYQIAEDGAPWPCEPGGVTIRYHAGQPLGKLLGAWRTLEGEFSKSFPIGLASKLTPESDATLYLRVNDSPAELSDNAGTLEVRIRRGDD